MFDIDISLCRGRNCKMCESCLRFKYGIADIEEENKTGIKNYNTWFVTPPAKSDTDCMYKL